MADYTPNSHKYREAQKEQSEPRKRVEKVTTGVVKTKKKSELHKLTDIFISEDIKNVKSYVVMDVLVPAIKKAISDIVTNGIDMILYGESGRNRRGSTNVGHVQYNSLYDRKDSDRRRESSPARVGYSYMDITLDSRGEAEEVLEQMDALIETYKVARVADLYDLVGVSGSFTDNRYGWKNLSSARVERTRDGGYKLNLPRALPIDD